MTRAGPGHLDLDAEVAFARQAYASARPESARLNELARSVMPGGNTRSVLDFEPFPFRVTSAAGAELIDVDGFTYVDFCGNYTAGLLGHSPKLVREAVVSAIDEGIAVGATHTREIELAQLVCERYESIDRVRFTNSGTEANLMAIGLALHHTGRSRVGVFEDAYHGGVLSFGSASGPLNVPHQFLVTPFDDLDALDEMFADPDDLGCVLVEAVQGSGGCRPASREFLAELRGRCTDAGTILILDEVMTSRLSPGGAQQLYDIRPDITTLGKYLGGGMSFGAFGGRLEIMNDFDPKAGGVLSQAGTFNNNVVSMAAAVATLRDGLDPGVLKRVNDLGDRLRVDLADAFAKAGLDMWTTGLGSMINVHARDDRWRELYFFEMLARGNYVARRGFLALSMEISDTNTAALLRDTYEWASAMAE